MPAAMVDYGKSGDEFRRLGEAENAAAADCLVGKGLAFLGREQQAWRQIYSALRSPFRKCGTTAPGPIFS